MEEGGLNGQKKIKPYVKNGKVISNKKVMATKQRVQGKDF
jgi:hypothetical protein